jgi:hypothetical protein
MSVNISGDAGVDKVQDGSIVDADLALTANSPSIKTALNASGTAPIFGCRAWVNFDGTRNVTDTGASTNGQPVKIRASGNVTSVTKNGVGDYTVNFTTAMSDVNYSAVVSSVGVAQSNVQANSLIGTSVISTSSVRLVGAGPSADFSIVSASVFR